LIYASSSSVYGMNKKIPFSTSDNLDHPISLYAATKKANELMAHSYSYLYQITTTGLRFFTVYGPWGRPDMAYFNFTKNIFLNKDIEVFNHGKMKRDFTYITDIISGILEVISSPLFISDNINKKNNVTPSRYRILNLGNNKPVMLMEFIHILEREIGKKALVKFEKMQDGDVLETWADLTETQNQINYLPKVDVNYGLNLFVNWYRSYYK
jgi:UDP-glucuronate 4-epimerase